MLEGEQVRGAHKYTVIHNMSFTVATPIQSTHLGRIQNDTQQIQNVTCSATLIEHKKRSERLQDFISAFATFFFIGSSRTFPAHTNGRKELSSDKNGIYSNTHTKAPKVNAGQKTSTLPSPAAVDGSRD